MLGYLTVDEYSLPDSEMKLSIKPVCIELCGPRVHCVKNIMLPVWTCLTTWSYHCSFTKRLFLFLSILWVISRYVNFLYSSALITSVELNISLLLKTVIPQLTKRRWWCRLSLSMHSSRNMFPATPLLASGIDLASLKSKKLVPLELIIHKATVTTSHVYS